mmetsp:Transcript_89676/g.254252  ORF Transcript_89676/g.254252 Transcript_89676/m.254252 type:complete len:335 (-) Transcript_89676:112-1116(-)
MIGSSVKHVAIVLTLVLSTPADGAQIRESFWNRPRRKARQARHGSHSNNVPSSFLSNDGLACTQGASRAVESVLALNKAGPYGALYNETFAHPNTNCSDHGFVFPSPDSGCHPGITTYFKDQARRELFIHEGDKALEHFRATYSLQRKRVYLMTMCVCHPESKSYKLVTNDCNDLDLVPGSWVHHAPGDDRELMCAQSTYEHAVHTLAALKSSPMLPMHLHDQIMPIPCNRRGYEHEFPHEDQCYPPMHMWTKTDIQLDLGLRETERVKKQLLKEGMDKFVKEIGLSDDLMSVSTCNCLTSSKVGKASKASCDRQGEAARSPVRDWWDGIGYRR